MAIKFELIKVGDILFDKRRRRMGNTMASRDEVFKVEIISIDVERESATVRWNGNPATVWLRKSLEGLYRKEPKRKPSIFDMARRQD